MRPGFRRKLFLLAMIVAPVLLTAAYLSPIINDPHIVDRHPEAKSSPRERTADSLRVLFIGNSFTFSNGGLPLSLQRMVEFARTVDSRVKPIIVERVTYPGASLEETWSHGVAVQRIGEGNWDYVVLQDYSRQALTDKDRAKMFDAITRFDGEIKKAGAKTLLFMTWALRNHASDQGIIAAAYEELGRRVGARVVPVGWAWQEVIRRRPGLDLYAHDEKHPSPAGSYLAACLFYTALYGRSPVGLTSIVADRGITFLDLPYAEAEFLQTVASYLAGTPTPTTERAIVQSGAR